MAKAVSARIRRSARSARVLAHRPQRHRLADQVGERATGEHRLHRVGVLPVAAHLEAEPLRVLRRPEVVGGTVVHRDVLSPELFEAGQLRCVAPPQEDRIGVEIPLAEQHPPGAPLGDCGGRDHELELPGVEPGEDRGPLRVHDPVARAPEPRRDFAGEVHIEALDLAIRRHHRVRGETHIGGDHQGCRPVVGSLGTPRQREERGHPGADASHRGHGIAPRSRGRPIRSAGRIADPAPGPDGAAVLRESRLGRTGERGVGTRGTPVRTGTLGAKSGLTHAREAGVRIDPCTGGRCAD